MTQTEPTASTNPQVLVMHYNKFKSLVKNSSNYDLGKNGKKHRVKDVQLSSPNSYTIQAAIIYDKGEQQGSQTYIAKSENDMPAVVS